MSNYVISTDVNGSFEILSGQINTSQTSLKLIGRGAAGYGYAIAENTIKHLSNFASPNAPLSPLKGQQWWDSTHQTLKVYVDSNTGWAEVATASSTLGDSSTFVTKTELYGASGNSSSPLLVSKGGTGLSTIGTPGQVLRVNSAGTGLEFVNSSALGVGGGGGSSDLSNATGVLPISKGGTGITTVGSQGQFLSSNGTAFVWVNPSAVSTPTNVLRTDITTSPDVDNSINLGSTTKKFNTIYASTFDGTAMSAKYADLAERYESSEVLEAGDVVAIGGDKEIHKASGEYSIDVFGVVSTAPAVKMNATAGTDETHPYIALAGRVPVKVYGKAKKGQRLVTSNTPGVAIAVDVSQNLSPFSVFARVLADKDTNDVGLVVAVIGAK